MARSGEEARKIITKINKILQRKVVIGGVSAAISSPVTNRSFSFSAGYADIVRRDPIKNGALFGIGSITKIFVSVVILQLMEEGKLQLTDTVGQHLMAGSYRNIDCAKTATLEQLLSHRAGIDSWEDDVNWIAHGRGRDIQPAYLWNRAETLNYIRRPKLYAPNPGEYYYANTNYTLLGLIIEKVTCSSAEEQIRLRILQPLKMDQTYVEGFEKRPCETAPHRYHVANTQFRDIAGIGASFPEVGHEIINVTGSNLSVEWLAGGIISSTLDLLKFGTAMHHGTLLKPASRAIMQHFQPASHGDEVGRGLFRLRRRDSGDWLGHFGGVLGFTAGLWWQTDCVVCLLANVGTVHAGAYSAVPSTIHDTEFLSLAAQLAQV